MKTAFQMFFLLICGSVAYGQSDTINQVDSNGLKQGFWKTYPDVTISEKKVRQEFLKEGHYCNDQKCGTWIGYFADEKTVKSRCGYVNGELHGAFTSYFENGQIKNKGVFVNGYFTGIHRGYYSDGKLESQRTYASNGTEIDTSFRYFSTGSIESMTIHDTLNHIDTYVDYARDGSVRREVTTVDHDIDHSFTLNSVNIIKKWVLRPESAEHYHFKLIFEGTPIYREYLLSLNADSSYNLVEYNYESCYNEITTSIGKWTKSNDEIQLSPMESTVAFNRLVVESNGNLTSEPIPESDRKLRTYTFRKIQL